MMEDRKIEILTGETSQFKTEVLAITAAVLKTLSARDVHPKDSVVILSEVMLNIADIISQDCKIEFLEMANNETTVIIGNTLNLEKNRLEHSLQNKSGSAGQSNAKH